MDIIETQELLNNFTQKLLDKWRNDNREDHQILRDKLIECGWRYSRKTHGGWYHPDVPNYPAPRTLRDLATIIAGALIKEALES